MKKFITGLIIGLSLITGTIFAAQVFNSNQVGSSPSNGYFLKTDGTNSTWFPAVGTTTSNTWTGLQIFTNASSTLFSTGYASSTLWYGGGMQTCNATTGKLTWANGQFACGTDYNTGGGGGGSGVGWATSTDDTLLYTSTASHTVLLGGNATTTTGYKLEVLGDILASVTGNIKGYGTITGNLFSATSTATSTFFGGIQSHSRISAPYFIATSSTFSSFQKLFATNASSSILSSDYASSTLYYGAGLADCDNAATSKLLWSDTGKFSCGTDQNTGSGGNVATSTTETAGQLSYWTSSGATPATLGQVATTTLTATAPLSLDNPIFVIGGTASVLTCSAASGSAAGCLSAANWNTFNNKVGTSSVPTIGNLAYWTGNGTPSTIGTVATTTLTGTYPVQLSQPISVIGSSASALSLAFGTTTSNTWAGTQTMGQASTTLLSVGTKTIPGDYYATFTISTTTTWTGTTTVPIGVAAQAETWNTTRCFTDTGTLNVQFSDGTNLMNLFNASTTIGTVGLSTNNTFTAGEKRYVVAGTPATSPTSLSCTIGKNY